MQKAGQRRDVPALALRACVPPVPAVLLYENGAISTARNSAKRLGPHTKRLASRGPRRSRQRRLQTGIAPLAPPRYNETMTTHRHGGPSSPAVTFWGAAQSVTGSMHLIEVGDHKFLLDCGL